MGKNVFSLLRSKEIIAILDGDKEFGDMTFEDKYGNEKNIKIAMPYLSGPAICEISSLFGLPSTYSWSGGALSRWQYFDQIRKLQEQVGHCRKIERSGRPGTAPAYGLRRARKNFKSHAANTASRKASNSSSGVRYPSFLRGRPFSSSAAERMSSSEKASMEAPFGTKARSRPLCCSFCGRSQDV